MHRRRRRGRRAGAGHRCADRGRRLSLVARRPLDRVIARVVEPGRYGSVEGLDAAAEAPRRITGIRWHANGLGYIADRPAHVFVIDAPDVATPSRSTSRPRPCALMVRRPEEAHRRGEATQLTDGSASHSGAVFTADGAEILDRRRRDRDRPRAISAPSIVAVRADGRGLADGARDRRGPLGRDIDVARRRHDRLPRGRHGRGVASTSSRRDRSLWVLEARRPAPAHRRRDDRPRRGRSHITRVGDDFLVQNRTRGRVVLLRVTRDGGA